MLALPTELTLRVNSGFRSYYALPNGLSSRFSGTT